METAAGIFPISTQFYRDDVESPSSYESLQSFSTEPWPTWRFRISNDVEIVQEMLAPRGMQGTMVRWKFEGNPQGVSVHVRPFLSGLDFHGTHHANDSLNSATTETDLAYAWQTYSDLPQVRVETNANVEVKPDWYNSFLYQAEQDRGLYAMEDLFSPAELVFGLKENDISGCLLLGAGKPFSEQAGLNLATRLPLQINWKRWNVNAERRSDVRDRFWTLNWSIAAMARRSLPVIRGLVTGVATRYFAARPLPCRARSAGCRSQYSCELGRGGFGRYAAEPVSRFRRHARIQLSRRVAVVRRRRCGLSFSR